MSRVFIGKPEPGPFADSPASTTPMSRRSTPEVECRTDLEAVEESVQKILDHLEETLRQRWKSSLIARSVEFRRHATHDAERAKIG